MRSFHGCRYMVSIPAHVAISFRKIDMLMSSKWLGICCFSAALMLVANVILTVIYLVIYGHFIDPGHEPKYCSDHVQVAGSYCGIADGSLLMFLAGSFCSRRFDRSEARKNVAGV